MMIINRMTFAFYFGSFDLLASFFQPFIYIILCILAFLTVSLIAWAIDEQIKKKNAALMKEQLPEIAAKFGKSISVSADALRFERNETIFDAKIKTAESSDVTSTEFEVRFNLPNLQEKFYIQHKSAFSKYSDDCEPLRLSAMPDDFIFHSLNSQFLLTLLEKEKILTELDKYPSSWLNQFFRIAFENNVFIISWAFIGLQERSKVQNLEQLCQTAVVFHDEIVALQRQSQL